MLHKLKNIFAFLVLMMLLNSCSRSIFSYTDHNGMSKYILYKENYKYVENSKFGRFSETGTYEANDSMISFVFKNKKKFPYTYFKDNILKLNKRNNQSYQLIWITEKNTNDPIVKATLTTKDSLGNYINKVRTSYKGGARIENIDQIKEAGAYKIEVSYVGMVTREFLFADYFEYDIKFEIEEPKPGGRTSDGCIVEFIDVILDYEIDHPTNFKKLKHNGIVFIKEREQNK